MFDCVCVLYSNVLSASKAETEQQQQQADFPCSRLHSLWQERGLRSRGLYPIKIWSAHSQALWVKCLKFKWWNPLALRVRELVIKRSHCMIYPCVSLGTSGKVDNNHSSGPYLLPAPPILCYPVSNIKGVIPNPQQVHGLHYHSSRHPSRYSSFRWINIEVLHLLGGYKRDHLDKQPHSFTQIQTDINRLIAFFVCLFAVCQWLLYFFLWLLPPKHDPSFSFDPVMCKRV